jgi:tripartite-type tricarboxylate transporter receptor subunit TctC
MRGLFTALTIAAICAAAPSWSQPYPSRPIRMLIPQPAGGTMDTIARMVSNQLVPVLGQNIVIDNRSGANGIIAGDTLAKAAPDGYTVLYTSASLVNNQLVHKKLSFDALRDFAPVTQVTTLPGYLILVNPQSPARTLKELIELSNKQPLHFGSSGVGNSQHLLGELINVRGGATMTHVPYKGFALIVTALMANEIQVAFGAPTTVVPHIKAGRLRAIAYTGEQRWSGMPDLPTAGETIKGFSYEASWHGIFAPRDAPRAVVSRLQAEVARIVFDPDMRAKLESGGHVPIGSKPEDFARFLRQYFKETEEQLRIAKVIK